MRYRTLSTLLLLAGLCPLLAAPLRQPVPRLHFTFDDGPAALIADRAASGLTLTPLGKLRISEGAIIFNGSEASTVAAEREAFKRWRSGVELRELSAAFWVRFDRLPTRHSEPLLGLFDCRVDQEGYLEVVLATAPTEIMASQLVLRSKTKVKRGEWHQVSFSYSANRRRYALYLDGRWQMENDQLLLPALTLGELHLGRNFNGALRDFRFYDVALESEELASATREELERAALQEQARALVAAAGNRGLKAWGEQLAQRAKGLSANAGHATLAEVRRLARDLANATTIMEGLKRGAGAGDGSSLACYTLPATTQELLQPYELPREGQLANSIDLYGAQGEFESQLLVVVPFRPLKQFTLQLGELRCGANRLDASLLDAKIVKRWYRTGGAWMTYHADKRQRVLVPDLLLNDDRTVRVDEIRASNELLMHYPDGERYVDVSRYAYDQVTFDPLHIPFYDADTLQPLDLPEAGRNQPFCLTFHLPAEAEPGLYQGKLTLQSEGRSVAELTVNLRVLPFKLPAPKTYYDLSRPYFSHINSAPDANEEIFRQGLQNLKNHNLLHASRVADAPWKVKIAKEIGYPLTDLISAGTPGPRDWWRNFGGPLEAIGTEEQECLDRLFLRKLQQQIDYYDEQIGPETIFYNCGASEASSYRALVQEMERGVELYHESGRARLLTHGMCDALPFFTGDYNDMDSATAIRRDWADIWHAAGGRIINYANPFPGAENPAWFRRRLGLDMYKKYYDGHMMHGYTIRFWNEFAEWPGGDGNYRNFGLVYAQRNGAINTLALIGVREGYDDVRYATKLKEQALQYRESDDIRLAREAKRQLHWLERVDGNNADMEAFRSGAAYRIVTLMELAKVVAEGR